VCYFQYNFNNDLSLAYNYMSYMNGKFLRYVINISFFFKILFEIFKTIVWFCVLNTNDRYNI